LKSLVLVLVLTIFPLAAASGQEYTFDRVDITAASPSWTDAFARIHFDELGPPITNDCELPTKACNCVFVFTSTQSESGRLISADYSVQVPAFRIEDHTISCPVAWFYSNLSSGELFRIEVIPGSGNSEKFTTNKKYMRKP
jgi:hypothetical protein